MAQSSKDTGGGLPDNDSQAEQGTSQLPKRRKQYLNKGEPLIIPRTTQYYRKKCNASQNNNSAVDDDESMMDIAGDISAADTELSGEELQCPVADSQADICVEDTDLSHNVQEEQEEGTVPLYEEAELLAECINQFGDERLPNSNVKKSEAIALVLSFAAGHSLTWSCLHDMLRLINTLLGCEALPRSIYMLRKLWAPKTKGHVREFFYCEDCGSLLQKEDTAKLKCTVCFAVHEQQELKKSGSFFTILNFQEQIKHVVKKNSSKLYTSLQNIEANSGSALITDITDGSLHKKLKENSVISKTDLTITFNTDGSPVWTSSKSSVWPIQVIVNELPASVRFKNCALVGLWFSKKHPNMTLFLEKFVEEVNETTVVWNHGSEQIRSKVVPLCCCVDTPARALVQNHVSFNGYFPCTWCYVAGEHRNGTMRFLNAAPDGERTDEMVKRDMKMALEFGCPVNGVKGPSPLMNFADFDLVWGQTVDYMHCILLGVTKQVTEHLLAMMTAADLAIVDGRLLAIRPPHCFTRLPRSLSDKAYWKASEWRHWLLFYSLPCTASILAMQFWKHLSLLVEATYILLSTELNTTLLRRADSCLTTFVSRMERLYGDSAMTYNVHQLLHLVKGVEALGPLWAHSAFVFEGGNGALVKSITAAKGVPHQITERVLMMQQLESLLSLLPLPFHIKQMCDNMLGYEPLKNFEYIGDTCMLGSPKYVTKFSETELAVLRRVTSTTAALEYYRFVHNEQLYHSHAYRKPNKSDSSFVITNSGELLRIERILSVGMHAQQKCYILCRKIVDSVTGSLTFPCHIRPCFISYVEALLVIEPRDIAAPCLFIHFPSDELSYVCLLPNAIERD